MTYHIAKSPSIPKAHPQLFNSHRHYNFHILISRLIYTTSFSSFFILRQNATSISCINNTKAFQRHSPTIHSNHLSHHQIPPRVSFPPSPIPQSLIPNLPSPTPQLEPLTKMSYTVRPIEIPSTALAQTMGFVGSYDWELWRWWRLHILKQALKKDEREGQKYVSREEYYDMWRGYRAGWSRGSSAFSLVGIEGRFANFDDSDTKGLWPWEGFLCSFTEERLVAWGWAWGWAYGRWVLGFGVGVSFFFSFSGRN